MLSVHETPQELLPEVVLSIEAAYINQYFSQQKLETQRGAELKNNANKLAKGTAQALLNFEHY
uniref:Uncharacterized protein n=1 Tax=Medicago truncatula TaxID=3880 RepID=Q2HTT2_MEDTR|nr:hypothetical protein MtrDRAFT_AC149801g28v2 [Medicago truncatula]